MAVKFKYKKSLYTTQAIKNSGIEKQEDFAKEFDRLARYTNARIDRLKAKYPRAEMLKNVDRSPMWKDILDERGIPNMTTASYVMSSNYKFLNKKVSTIRGYEHQLKKSIRSFNKLFPKDENPINENNIFDLFDFLEDYRQKYNMQKIPDSEEVIDVFAEAERLYMDSKSLLKDIEFWKEHYDEMTELEPIESENPVNSSEYKEQLR